MNFNEYYKVTINVMSSIYKSRLFLAFSLKTFQNFPNNIHSTIRKPFDKSLDYSLREWEACGQEVSLEPRDEDVIEGARLIMPFIYLQRINRQESQKNIINTPGGLVRINDVNFQQQILEQNLVYLIGIIESFIYDSVKVIYINCPEHLKKHDLGLSFSDILEYENMDDIRGQMIEKAMGRTWSTGSFSTRITKLQKKFKINVGFKKKLQDLLDEANLIRNCILHNGSKVSSDYASQFGERRNAKVDEPILINPFFLDAIFYLSIDLIKALFIEASGAAWDLNHKSDAEDGTSLISSGFYKNFMLQKDHWIYEELHENGIL